MLKFYYSGAPNPTKVALLLEETGTPYDPIPVDTRKGEQHRPEFLAINPMGKSPAIVHRDTVVTESAAILAYLADAFPEAGLAPALGDPQRGTYLRWLFFGAGPGPGEDKSEYGMKHRKGSAHAVKCDMCKGLAGPACVRACPTGAAIRVSARTLA